MINKPWWWDDLGIGILLLIAAVLLFVLIAWLCENVDGRFMLDWLIYSACLAALGFLFGGS